LIGRRQFIFTLAENVAHNLCNSNNTAPSIGIIRVTIYAMELWNSLPPEIKDCPSLTILKSRLTSRVDHDNVPKY